MYKENSVEVLITKPKIELVCYTNNIDSKDRIMQVYFPGVLSLICCSKEVVQEEYYAYRARVEDVLLFRKDCKVLAYSLVPSTFEGLLELRNTMRSIIEEKGVKERFLVTIMESLTYTLKGTYCQIVHSNKMSDTNYFSELRLIYNKGVPTMNSETILTGKGHNYGQEGTLYYTSNTVYPFLVFEVEISNYRIKGLTVTDFCDLESDTLGRTPTYKEVKESQGTFTYKVGMLFIPDTNLVIELFEKQCSNQFLSNNIVGVLNAYFKGLKENISTYDNKELEGTIKNTLTV